MRRLHGWFVAAGLVLAAACSEATGPVTVEPTFAKDKGGGVGSPHFSTLGTACTLNESNGNLACDFQVAGLGKYGSAIVTMVGLLDVDYKCVDSYGTIKAERTTLRISEDLTVFANESGNATGHLEDDVLPVTRLECLVGWRLYNPAEVVFGLYPEAKAGLPTARGEWMLSAAAVTAKKNPAVYYYSGSLVLPPPPPI